MDSSSQYSYCNCLGAVLFLFSRPPIRESVCVVGISEHTHVRMSLWSPCTYILGNIITRTRQNIYDICIIIILYMCMYIHVYI